MWLLMLFTLNFAVIALVYVLLVSWMLPLNHATVQLQVIRYNCFYSLRQIRLEKELKSLLWKIDYAEIVLRRSDSGYSVTMDDNISKASEVEKPFALSYNACQLPSRSADEGSKSRKCLTEKKNRTDSQTNKKTDRQTNRKEDRQTDIQTDRQTRIKGQTESMVERHKVGLLLIFKDNLYVVSLFYRKVTVKHRCCWNRLEMVTVPAIPPASAFLR